MEGNYLVTSKESTLPMNSSNYGAVNKACLDDNGKPLKDDFKSKMETSFEDNMMRPKFVKRSCSCSADQGDCDCGKNKRNVQLEPWARYKTITMVVGLSFFGIWIIVISIVAKNGKL